jgi:hypothetical protein
VFGGGWGPEGNQASIERDALRLGALLPEADVLFADGASDRRTVQTATAADPLSWRLGLVFGRTDALGVTYRRPRIRPRGPATPGAVMAALVELARRPSGGVAFGVGHGRPAAQDAPAALELWGGPLDVAALARELDAGAARGPLALVLGQCHSGAFRDIAYRAADASAPLARPARCVLAAVPRDREAAGCSPDARDPRARAFVHALATGVERGVDYDGDGDTGLDDAFAFALVHDDTVDVPVRTSDLWLREEMGEIDLAEVTRPALLAAAPPAERAALEALQPEGAPREVQERHERLAARAEALDARLAGLEGAFEDARLAALDQLLDAFPELANPYHPRARALLAGAATAVRRVWSADPRPIRALEAADRRWTESASDRWALETEAARLERWLRVAASVWGARQLEGEARRTWRRLRACEALVPRPS